MFACRTLALRGHCEAHEDPEKDDGTWDGVASYRPAQPFARPTASTYWDLRLQAAGGPSGSPSRDLIQHWATQTRPKKPAAYNGIRELVPSSAIEPCVLQPPRCQRITPAGCTMPQRLYRIPSGCFQ